MTSTSTSESQQKSNSSRPPAEGLAVHIFCHFDNQVSTYLDARVQVDKKAGHIHMLRLSAHDPTHTELVECTHVN